MIKHNVLNKLYKNVMLIRTWPSSFYDEMQAV